MQILVSVIDLVIKENLKLSVKVFSFYEKYKFVYNLVYIFIQSLVDFY